LRPPSLLVGAAAVAVVVTAIPLLYLVVRTVDAGGEAVIAALWRQRTLDTAVTSITLVVAVVIGCLILAVPTAWLLARTSIPGRSIFLVTAALPLAVPSYVMAYAWIAEFPGMSGMWAAVLVMSLASFPYVAVPLTAALRGIDAGHEEAARSLGLGPIATAWRVTLPMAWPAAAAGLLLAALYTLSEFGTVAIFRVDAFTRVIYTAYRASFDRTAAAVLALLLVLLALILVIVEARVRGRAQRWRVGSGVSRPAPRTQLSPVGTVLGLAWLVGVAVLSLGVPTWSLLMRLLESRRVGIDVAELGGAIAGSITASTFGAVVALALALPVAALAARYSSRFVRGIEGAAFLGHALPGVVVGLSLVFLTLAVFPAVYQTIFTVAFAYAILFMPKAIGASRSAIASVPPALESTARSLGRGPLRAWFTVTGRLAWPGIAAGALLVLLTAMKELPATLMLRPTGFDTLATRLWTRVEIEAFGSAAPYALAMIVLASVPAWLMARWLARSPEHDAVAHSPDLMRDDALGVDEVAYAGGVR
jgi:iron(III) transport system permease protein